MQNKIIRNVLVIGLIFLLFGINTPALYLKDQGELNICSIEDYIEFSQPTFENIGEYLLPKINETDMFLRHAGKPMLPLLYKTYNLPFNAKIIDVNCNMGNIYQDNISGKIKPASNIWYIPAINAWSADWDEVDEIIFENSSIYNSSSSFPNDWFDFKINCGIDKGVNYIFLTLSIYPILYSPLENIIKFIDSINITVTYEKPSDSENPNIKYDMVIIAPNKFKRSLQRFIDHKNKIGILTTIKPTEEIFQEYPGRDKPEQIKYFIKYAKEEWGINYVLLVGGLKYYIYAKDKDDCNQGSSAWHVPVRYNNLEEWEEKGCPSDLYYADIYKYNISSNSVEFEDWDPNGNNIFSEGNQTRFESIDLCPDVNVGRLACRNSFEVNVVVNKIIDYESSYHKDEEWFKRMISISGRIFTSINGRPDGEVYCDVSIDYMKNLIEPVRIYASNNETGGPIPKVGFIAREISKGASFVHFEGHANPVFWNVLWGENYSDDDLIGGISVYDFWRLFNGKKLPVMVVDGCHTALFNITLITSIFSKNIGNNHCYWTSGAPTIGCLCWRLVAKPNGGAVASIGCTAGEDPSPHNPFRCIGFSISFELNYNFFYQIGKNNVTKLGDAFSSALCKAVTNNFIRSYETYGISVHQLFGDPSLKFGGY